MDNDTNMDIETNFYKGWRAIASMYKLTFGKDISLQNILILNYCRDNNNVQIKDLVCHLDLDASAVSTLVKRMINRGWLIRKHGKKDLRTVFVNLTIPGQKYQESIENDCFKLTEDISSELSLDEKKAFNNIVNKIITKKLQMQE